MHQQWPYSQRSKPQNSHNLSRDTNLPVRLKPLRFHLRSRLQKMLDIVSETDLASSFSYGIYSLSAQLAPEQNIHNPNGLDCQPCLMTLADLNAIDYKDIPGSWLRHKMSEDTFVAFSSIQYFPRVLLGPNKSSLDYFV